MNHDVLVLAELNPDVVVACDAPVRFGQVEQLVERAGVTLGSSGAITAAALAAQGLDVALCAVVGDDAIGTLTTGMLADLGVDVGAVQRRSDVRTGMTVVLTRPDGDRALLTYPGAMATLTAADVAEELLADTRHVHVSSYYLQRALQPGLAGLLHIARGHGASTSLDPGWDPAEQWAQIATLLPELDYLLPNALECLGIANSLAPPTSEPIAAAHTVAALGTQVAVKLGGDGAAFVSNRSVFTVRSATIRCPVDSTGAGDNFNAGFIAAVLSGAQADQCLTRAAACGAISVTGFGGTGRLATEGEALAAAASLSFDVTEKRTLPKVVEESA